LYGSDGHLRYGERRDVRAQHVKRAVADVHQLHDPKRKAQAQCHQKKGGALAEAVNNLKKGVQRHARVILCDYVRTG
jgi:hypothetical protein